MQAPYVALDGAHFICRECAAEVNMLIRCQILGQVPMAGGSSSMYLEPGPAALAAAPQPGRASGVSQGQVAPLPGGRGGKGEEAQALLEKN